MAADPNKDELTDAEKLDYVINQSILGVRTIMIAECVSFNEARNTIVAQPSIMRKRIGNEAAPIPPLQDIPVVYYGAGGVVATYKPVAGDNCILLISDRSIERWKKTGGVVDPAKSRHHNWNDAVALFGLNWFGAAIESLKGGFDFRTRDGQTSFHLEGSVIDMTVGGVPVAEFSSSLIDFKVPIQAPSAIIATTMQAATVSATTSLTVDSIEMGNHVHGGVANGTGTTDPVGA